jgi:histidine triad (HIT) family protein
MCKFCDIVAGRISAHIVYEDAVSLAFLDHRPLFFGHSLLVPRHHHVTLADLPTEEVEPFFVAARALARAIEGAMEAEGTFVAINNRVSQSVPHLHAHVVPRRRKDGLRGFFWPRQRYADDHAMTAVQQRILSRVGKEREQPAT